MKVLNNRAYHNLVIFDARRGTLTREFTNTLEYKVSYLSESYVCFFLTALQLSHLLYLQG